jgi:hypothetical protein
MSTTAGDDSIEALVELHLRSPLESDERGRVANKILNLVWAQPDLDALAPLFVSSDRDATRTLVFVLSEIGERSAEAMGWLDALLDSPDEWVRHHAIVAVQHSGSCDQPAVVAHALRCLGDVRSVRLAAVRFAAHGSLMQIASAAWLVDGRLGSAVGWLVGGAYDDAERWLADHDLAVALVGLAGAFRAGDAESSRIVAASPELADALAWLNRTALPVDGSSVLRRLANRPRTEG